MIANSTAYCQQGVMANGQYVHEGSVAMNDRPLGSRITVSPPFYGRRLFVVRDRIGYGSQLDFWTGSCTAALRWGRRNVRVRSGWPRESRIGRLIVGRYRQRV